MSASPYSVTHLSVDDGLSQSTVTAIVQDAQGFLWFATSDGLNRYDGNSFVILQHEAANRQSLSSDDLWSLALTGSKTIWVGSAIGLDRYDKDRNAISPVSLQGNSTTTPGHVTQLAADPRGALWIGTTKGLQVIVTDSASSIPSNLMTQLNQHIGTRRINTLFIDSHEQLWIGVDDGLFVLTPAPFKIQYIAGPHPSPSVQSIFEDSEHTMWFGTSDARLLSCRQPKTSAIDKMEWSVYPVQSAKPKMAEGNFIYAIVEDQSGCMWVGTRLAGLFQFDKKLHTWNRFTPPIANQRFEGVRTMCVDHSGILWVGYDGAGILKIDPHPPKFHHLLLPNSDASVTGANFFKPILVDHTQRLWIGTYDQGLNLLNRSVNTLVRFRHNPNVPTSISNNSLLALAEDRSGRIWAGTPTGIDCFDEKRNSFAHFSTRLPASTSQMQGAVWGILSDSAGVLWVGTSEALLKFDENSRSFVPVFRTDTLVDNWVISLAQAVDLSLWIGTSKSGLFHLDRSGRVLEHWNTTIPNSICNDYIKCVSALSDGSLWIGTLEGVSRFDVRSRSWRSFHVSDGLPDETVYGILQSDSATFWLSTNRGLVRMTVHGESPPVFRNYTPEDGLQSFEFNTNCYFRASTGEMFFGGINGLNTFFPDSITENPHVPPIVITGFKKFDRPFKLEQASEIIQSITLDYRESVFSFEFAALEFSSPHRNRYAYMMDGYDREWVQCGNRREARYTNLDPGTYVFRVRGSNDDGVWNMQGAAVTISIVPPFWRTRVFFVATACVLAGMFGGTVRYVSVRKMRKKLERVEQEKRLEQHRHETRGRIARDLHDDVSSTLSSMSLFVESSRLRTRSDARETEAVLARLHQMALGAEEAMEQAVWSLSTDRQHLSHLLARIHDVAIELCQEHHIACHIEIPALKEDIVLADVVRKNFYLIFRESLANIIRHAHAQSVTISFDDSDGNIKMTVSDDGVGIVSGDHSPKSRGGNGLNNMHARAKEIGALLDISSSPDKGTTVTVGMKIAQMHY